MRPGYVSGEDECRGNRGTCGSAPARARRAWSGRRALRAAPSHAPRRWARSCSTSATGTCTRSTSRRWSTPARSRGAPKFVGCSFQFGNPARRTLRSATTALEYAGDPSRDPATRNLQRQEPNDVHVRPQRVAVLDATAIRLSGGARVPRLHLGHRRTRSDAGDDPCTREILDVKATDDDVPLSLGFCRVAVDPKTKAQSRDPARSSSRSGCCPGPCPRSSPPLSRRSSSTRTAGQVIGRAAALQQSRMMPTCRSPSG